MIAHLRKPRLHRRFATSPRPGASSPDGTPPRYPYPTSANPTPHEIFHLPISATQADIKARYYDLVKQWHPDSAHCRGLPAATRHERFNAISKAYDILRGRAPRHSMRSHGRDGSLQAELARRRRAAYARGPVTSEPASSGTRDAQTLFGALGLFAVIATLLHLSPPTPTQLADIRHNKARANLAEARARARESGKERREEMRRWRMGYTDDLPRGFEKSQRPPQ